MAPKLTMAYRRKIGLTNAHFDSVALRDPALIATLPFDQNRVRRYITDQVLFRTRQRWSWFTDARKLNPALGTLYYLPPEVRSMIWQALLYYRKTLSTDGMWEYDRTLGSPLSLSAYYFGYGRRHLNDSNVSGLRLVSSTAKLEFDEAFLSNYTFRFNHHENLAGFFKALQDTTKILVRSIDIGICPLYDLDSWMGTISQLPQGLHYIQFRLYPTIRIPNTEVIIQRNLEFLERLVQTAAKSAPRARVSISSTIQAPLQPTFQAAVDGIMERLRKNH